MLEYLRKVSSQIYDFVRMLPPAKKFALGLVGSGIFIAIFFLFVWASSKTYRPLMTNLSTEDSANIMRILRENKIPFRVDSSGRNIEIPPENVDDWRLALASMGLPQSSVVGYELFDKQTLGTSSFVQRINEKRAREGELMRTINSIKGVKRSRIHLVMPEKSAFVEEQRKPSASVVLDLEPGRILTDKQIFGVANLVAKAVEGMEPGDVAIVDSNGKPLSKGNQDSLMALTASQLEYQRKVEEDLERRVEALLGRVVGEGKVVARVNAELDFSKVDETQTQFDGDAAAVRSAEKQSESLEGSRPVPQGPAGAAANLPEGTGGTSGATQAQLKNDSKRSRETTNFEVPQTIRRTSKQLGSINRISVAVLVDGKAVKTTDPSGKVETKVESWPPEKLKEFEVLVNNAVGIQKKRGDTLEVKNMEFTREDFEEATKTLEATERRGYVQNIILYMVIGLLITMFFMFVVRPFIKWITENTIDSVDTFLPKTIEELERMQKNGALPGLEETVPVLNERIAPEKVEGEMIKEKIINIVDTSPNKAALVLRDWIRGEMKSKKSTEDEEEKAG